MRYTRRLISFVILTMLVGLGSLMLSTAQVRATENGGVCTITIEKVANPADNTPFTFIISGDETDEFTLMDPDEPTTVRVINAGETIIITEELPPGWLLDSIACGEGDDGCEGGPCLNITIDEATNSITAECIDDDARICIFTNDLRTTDVPTLSQWGLIAMAGVLGIVGFMVMRRRKVTA